MTIEKTCAQVGNGLAALPCPSVLGYGTSATVPMINRAAQMIGSTKRQKKGKHCPSHAHRLALHFCAPYDEYAQC